MQETAKPPVPIAAARIEPEPATPPLPAVVNVYQTVTQHVDAPAAQTSQPYYTIPVAVPVYVGTPVVRTPHVTVPTYWGWGGQRRPDSWQPDRDPRGEPSQQPPDKNKGGR
jgi:hypothetical protein